MICLGELGPVSPRAYPPPRAGLWTAIASSPAGVQSWSREGLGLRCFAGRRRPGADANRSLQKHQGYLRLLQAVEEANPAGEIYLITDNLASHKSPPIQEWLAAHHPGRVGVHPERRGLAQLAGGVVANVPSGGFGRSALRRRREDRDGYEGSRQTAQSSGETVGMGTRTQTAEASETHFCVTSLRNGAVETQPP